MDYLKKTVGDCIVYKVFGELNIGKIELIEALATDIREEGKKSGCKFIWDFSALETLDSSGLSVIALSAAYSFRNDSHVKVCAVKKDAARLLGAGALSLHFKVYETLEEAIGEQEFSGPAVLEMQI